MALQVQAVRADGAQLVATGPDTYKAALVRPDGRGSIVTRSSVLARGYWEDPPDGATVHGGVPDDLERRLIAAEPAEQPPYVP